MTCATRFLALELGEHNIRVNQAVMGWLDGPGVRFYLTMTAEEKGVSEQDVYDDIASRNPLGRIPTDDACAGAILMLLSKLLERGDRRDPRRQRRGVHAGMRERNRDGSYRVIQWATGTVGIHAVPAIAAHPDLDLVGLWVHSDSKAGLDAGEICGIGPLGVHRHATTPTLCSPPAPTASATRRTPTSAPARWSTTWSGSSRPAINVVNTSFVPLLYPEGGGRRFHDRLERRVPRGRRLSLHVGHRPGLRQRRPRDLLARSLQGGPHGADDGDRQLRHVEQPLHDVRHHGVRQARRVGVVALGAGLDGDGVGTGGRAGRGGPRRRARPHRRVARGDPRRRRLRDRCPARLPPAPSPACASRSWA